MQLTKKSKLLTLTLTLSLLTASIITVSANINTEKIASTSTNPLTRYEKLALKNKDFEQRAQKSGIVGAHQVEIAYPDNKDKTAKIKPLEEMKGYIKYKDLKNNAKYITKELLTYEQFINKYPVDLDLSISKNRMIYVTATQYPNGFKHKKGFVKNALLTKYYDAETGELLGYGLKSLEKGGNGIRMTNDKNGTNTNYVRPEDKK